MHTTEILEKGKNLEELICKWNFEITGVADTRTDAMEKEQLMTAAILELGRMSQPEGCKFKARLGYTERPWLRKPKTRAKHLATKPWELKTVSYLHIKEVQ